ncbi:MAG: nitroreductase [Chloroflexota bacterium]|nr:MAG: nitroreductase [Chloroflexota bacterium]
MELSEAISKRKSIRGYKPESVPMEVLKKVLETATRSPSAMNTQPWEVTVLTGETLDKVRKANIEMLMSGAEPWRSISYQGVHRQRQVDLAVQLFKLMGIAREDKEKRAQWLERGFRFFDAPAAIILSIDSSAPEWLALLDIGAFCQSICLAALEYGLGTCIEDQGTMFPDVLRRFTAIPESKNIVISIAIGYPDRDFPANKLESDREPVDSFTTWCGFEHSG